MSALRIALNIGSLVLVAVLGWLVVRIATGIVAPESLASAEPIIAPSTNGAIGTPRRDYDFSTDPFSLAAPATIDAPLIEDAPETTLNLKLKGIVSESNATFRLPDGQDKAVALNEEVMNGVILTRTAKDFVLLDVNGETQRLTLERIKLGKASGSAAIMRAEVESGLGGNGLAKRAEVEDLFTKIKMRPSIEILPDRTTRLQGYEIEARAGADLSVLGLQDGDIVTRIGPVLLDTNRTNIRELRELIATGAAQDVELLRNGAPVTIRIGQ